mmetsp:Transcript_30069/g.58751  ORF Transcript_30069/g.58751 Transcript_30069/m.58751 type:complete len:454 (+) Transcript_30069:127-1488(+)
MNGLTIYQDIAQDDQDSWRRSKRGADESKGVPANSVGGPKRNRSALANISNQAGSVSHAVSKPTTRLAASMAVSTTHSLSTHIASAHESVSRAHGRYMPSASAAASSAPVAAATGRDKMVLSPCTSEAVSGLTDLLGKDDGMETDDSGLQSSSSQIYSQHSAASSSSAQGQPAPARILFAQDCLNQNNTQFCVEYAHEIYGHLLATEQNLMPASDYMDRVQHDINPTMRGILVDWLVEVAEEYKLSSENLYLSTNYVDRFLTVMPVMRGRLQLVGVSCMLIASKYEEIFAPQVDDFVYITDNTYSSTELLHMETVILNALRFNLTAVTPHTFLRRITSLLAVTEQVRHLCAYLAEITIQEFHFLKYKPSVIALSAVILALHTMDMEVLPDTLRLLLKVWERSLEELTPCIRDIHLVHYKIFDKTRTMQASYEKYSHQRWSRVSLIHPKQTPPF